jgi:lysine-specific demethylase/histidyl-hydroxylase NO66
VGGRPYQGAADVAKVYRAFAEGATIVLQSLHRSWAPLARFCRDLELRLTHPVQANAYLTPAGATALAPHHDTHDVFVLQVHGRKHWEVRQPVVEAPLPRHHSRKELAAGQPLLFDAELAPGDCLYLPRGFVHAARTQEDTSLHVTVGVHAVTRHDVLQAVVERAAEHPAFRVALPVGFARSDAGDALAAAVDECVRETGRWLASLDTGPIAGELRHGFWSRRLPLLEGQLQQLVTLDQLDDTSVVRRRPDTVCEVEHRDDGLRLVLGDRGLNVPVAVEPAIRRLLDDRPGPVAALDDLLDASSRLVLVRRLVLEGVLEVVPGGA